MLTPISPSPSLQQPPRTSLCHTPYTCMPHRRFGANGITAYSLSIPLPLHPSFRFFFACGPPQSLGMHVHISPNVFTILLYINMIYLSTFPCPSKPFSFGSNINQESHIAQHTEHVKAYY